MATNVNQELKAKLRPATRVKRLGFGYRVAYPGLAAQVKPSGINHKKTATHFKAVRRYTKEWSRKQRVRARKAAV